MLLSQLLVLLALAAVHADETILGAYIFHRHGDRSAKYWPPVLLTDLGYLQIFDSGSYFRNRYITNSPPIAGIQRDIVQLSQLDIQSPIDTVLQPSSLGWVQGLYPPVGQTLGSQTLANTTIIQAPLNGYQLIPVNAVNSPAASSLETASWLQGASGCANAIISSNNYFISQDYLTTKAKTDSFYSTIYPVVNNSLTSSYVNYKNAYSIYDIIHVAQINNKTIQSSELLTPDNVKELTQLAFQHEWNLAYNASEPIRSVAGATLAGQIVAALTGMINGKSTVKLSVQFGPYASFLAFFGLAQLHTVSDDFTGVVDYASSMVFELVTTADVSKSYPTVDQISVRFSFSNGSAALNGGLQTYPLFNQSQVTLPWNTYLAQMNKFALADQTSWCAACGNSTGVCAPTTSTSPAAVTSAAVAAGGSTNSGSSISNPVAGVIGAMVTLAVILGLAALIFLIGGLRLVSKRRMSTGGASGSDSEAGHVSKA